MQYGYIFLCHYPEIVYTEIILSKMLTIYFVQYLLFYLLITSFFLATSKGTIKRTVYLKHSLSDPLINKE